MILAKYILLASTSLFFIMDPVALIPTFLAMTPHDTPASRIRMARLACTVAAIVMWIFTLVGEALFKILGITLPAFKIAGSIVLLLVAMDMLRAKRSPVHQTVEEEFAGAAKDDIAVTPLAIPMLVGPGALSTVLLLKAQAANILQYTALMISVGVVCALSYFILRWASFGARLLSPIVINIVMRIMGLLLAAVAIQFILDAIREQKALLFGVIG